MYPLNEVFYLKKNLTLHYDLFMCESIDWLLANQRYKHIINRNTLNKDEKASLASGL